jgi:hypothetical protein
MSAEFRARFCAGTGDRAHVPRFTHGESLSLFLGGRDGDEIKKFRQEPMNLSRDAGLYT